MARDGLRVWATAERVAVIGPDGCGLGPTPLTERQRYLRPADLARTAAGGVHPDGLLVVHRATEAALAGLMSAGQAWACSDGRYALPAGPRRRAPLPPDPIATRRPPSAAATLALLLLWRPGLTHAEYARVLGVTRERVTQLLDGVPRDDPRALLTLWRASSDGTAGHVSRWAGIGGGAWDLATSAYRTLDDAGCEPVLGGQVAADVLATWRAPASSVLHVRKVPPPPPGFVIADSPASADVIVVVGRRATVPALASVVSTVAGELRVAHPLHVAADLADDARLDDRVAEHLHLVEEVADDMVRDAVLE